MRVSIEKIFLALWLLLWLAAGSPLLAEEGPTTDTAIECGDIIEGEFTQQRERHVYRIKMKPAEEFSFSFVPVGDFLTIFEVQIYDPAKVRIHRECCYDHHKYQYKSGKVSARGTYSVFLQSRTAGVYTFHLGCELRDGTKIAPGESRAQVASEAAPGDADPASAPSQPPPPSAEFRGFPGLGPIDLSGLAFPKLQIGIPVDGEITDRGETFGFQFEGARGREIDLRFQRLTGDLGLALVVLDPSGGLVFQATLADSKTLATNLTLPSNGEYTLALAKVSLPDRSEGESTAFRVEIQNR